jgi:hypothetical protein
VGRQAYDQTAAIISVDAKEPTDALLTLAPQVIGIEFTEWDTGLEFLLGTAVALDKSEGAMCSCSHPFSDFKCQLSAFRVSSVSLTYKDAGNRFLGMRGQRACASRAAWRIRLWTDGIE